MIKENLFREFNDILSVDIYGYETLASG